jgi:hypothetical protein
LVQSAGRKRLRERGLFVRLIFRLALKPAVIFYGSYGAAEWAAEKLGISGEIDGKYSSGAKALIEILPALCGG